MLLNNRKQNSQNFVLIFQSTIFFKKAIKYSEYPIKVNIDKSGSNTSALKSINKALSKEDKIEIRQNKHLNNL